MLDDGIYYVMVRSDSYDMYRGEVRRLRILWVKSISVNM